MRPIHLAGLIAPAVLTTLASAQCFDLVPLGQGQWPIYTPVDAMTTWDPDGPGSSGQVLVTATRQYVSSTSSYVWAVLTWDGTTWTNRSQSNPHNGPIHALKVYGGNLIAGGDFTSPFRNVAQFTPNGVEPLGTGIDDVIYALEVQGGELIAGGESLNTGVSLRRWNGAMWRAGNFGSTVYTAKLYNNTLYVAGPSHFGVYDPIGAVGNAAPPTGINGMIYSMTVHDGALVVAGSYNTFINPNYTVRNIAMFNSGPGQQGWAPFTNAPSGFAGIDGPIYSLASTGPTLVVGGSFTSAFGVTGLNNLAAFNAGAWQPLGAGTNANVFSLAYWDNAAWTGGNFTRADNSTFGSAYLARWNTVSLANITGHPQPITVFAGLSASLTASSDTSGVSYRWRRNGQPVVDGVGGASVGGGVVAGATSPTITITDIKTADAGTYQCVLTTPCGAISTNSAAFTVTPSCDSIDFNNDGLFPDTADIDAMLSVFSGGQCVY